MDEANQAERVKRHQVAVAKSMGLPPAVLEVLLQTEDWQLREWLYVCALDGFPFERLKEHARRKTDVATLCRIREDFWRDRVARAEAVQRESLKRDVESLGREVEQAGRESRAARTAIEIGMEESVKRREREHAEELRTKDATIRSLKRQVANLEERLLQPKDAKETSSGKSVGKKTSLDTAGGLETDAGRKAREQESQDSFLQVLKNRLTVRRREGESRKFIEKFAANKELKPEQVDFLLECLEEGVSVREMERFTAPGIPVEVMRRLKELDGREQDKKGGREGYAGSRRGDAD